MTRVLVIDDSPTVRKLVEIAFRPTGWKPFFAPTGAEGVAQARAGTPDAILLDFVLPDMKGLDVCEKLARDDRTASIPIVLMTAKGADVRALFKPYHSLSGFVPKPFTPETVLDAIRVAVAGRSGSASSGSRPLPSMPRAEKEAIAKALYGRLRQPLASIPMWAEQLGNAAAAPFFAKKLLTPEVVDDLVAAITPLLSPAAPARAREQEDDAPLRGVLGAWPARDLLTFVAGSGRTGELRLDHGERDTVIFFRGGEIVLVTTHDPARWLRDAALDLSHLPRAHVERAEIEQRSTGRPVAVTLAEGGHLPRCDLTSLLHGQSKRLLREAAAENKGSFAFRDLAALPLYVEAHGRHVSLARETLMFGPQAGTPSQSLGQLTLEKLRADLVPVALLPRPLAVFNRTRGFSDRVRHFALTSEERTVLALVDGRTPLEDLAHRSGLDLDVMAVAHRLAAVGLITECDPRPSGSGSGERRPVMILEPDVEGFQRPLESLLASRAQPLPLMSLAAEPDVLAAVRKARPRLVILNAAAGHDVDETARAIREERELADVSLVAVLEAPMASRQGELFAAGFDAVLVKPVAYTELERLLSA